MPNKTYTWKDDSFVPRNDKEAEEHRKRLLLYFQQAFPGKTIVVEYKPN